MSNETEVTDLTVLSDVQAITERPKSLDPRDLAGTEDIEAQDIRLPRLTIAQGLSNQMMPNDGQYIEGLKLFDFFNDLTGEIYGRGPLLFVPTRRDVRRIEFIPRDEGGGIADPDVPVNDPRLRWIREPDGNKIPPRATTFHEFVILLLRPHKAPEPIVLSIKDTNKYNRRAFNQLTTFIKLRQAPIYAGLYTVASGVEKNDKGTFGVPLMKNAGWIPKDTPAGAALFEFAKKFHESLEGKTLIVNREAPDQEEFNDTQEPGEM